MTKYIIVLITSIGIWLIIGMTQEAKAAYQSTDVLIKFKAPVHGESREFELLSSLGGKSEILTENLVLWKPSSKVSNIKIAALAINSMIEWAHPNFKISLMQDYRIQDSLRRRALQKSMSRHNLFAQPMPADNPAIPATPGASTQGADPNISKQWGMIDIEAPKIWKSQRNPQNLVVAVIDSGVDYTHEDLKSNLWRNPSELGTDAHGRDRQSNGVDDDGNGFIDDVIGWDFVSNDRLPFDLAVDPLQLLAKGGNPGHGTHCAGSIAARGNNALGISGISPQAKIMVIRFLSEKGSGTTADAVKAIRYAVDNGAKILSNSWGSEGEDPNEKQSNLALREVIQYAEARGVLFIAAAGNGHSGAGYNNDTDAKPAYPASYPYSNIISVAAIDSNDRLGGFSNWGIKSVHIAAPGLNVYSTTVGNLYSDKVIDLAAIEIPWEGTSMAAPHVAGAAAAYWSERPNKSFLEIKDAILSSAKAVPALQGKIASAGKLNLVNLFSIK